MHLSSKRFSSSGPALTCLLGSHREPLFPGTDSRCLQAEATGPSEPGGDAAGVRHSPWTRPPCPLGAPKGWTHLGDLPESCELGPHPALGALQDPFNPSPTHTPSVRAICKPVPVRK